MIIQLFVEADDDYLINSDLIGCKEKQISNKPATSHWSNKQAVQYINWIKQSRVPNIDGMLRLIATQIQSYMGGCEGRRPDPQACQCLRYIELLDKDNNGNLPCDETDSIDYWVNF